MGVISGQVMTYFYVIREDPGGEAIGLFEWGANLLGAAGGYPYYLNPDDDGGRRKCFWVDKINKSEFDTYRQIVSISVKDVEQLVAKMGSGGDIQFTAGNGGGCGTGGAIQITSGNGLSGGGGGGSIVMIGGNGGI
jgi:hypothetical protein